MPFLMGGRGDGSDELIYGGNLSEPVVYNDHDLYKLSPQQQFADIFSKSETKHLIHLKRHEFDVGRLYWRLKRTRKSLPGRVSGNHVCDRFKQILEELEPDFHKFVPIDLRLPDGQTPWPEPYWYWHNDHFVESIIPDIGDGDPRRTSGYRWHAEKGYFADEHGVPLYSATIPIPTRKPVLNVDAIAGVHAWRDPGFALRWGARIIFFSDELVRRLKAVSALRGFSVREVAVSDLPIDRPITGGES